MKYTREEIGIIKKKFKKQCNALNKAIINAKAINALKEKEMAYIQEVVLYRLPEKYKTAKDSILIPLDKTVEFIHELSKEYPLYCFLKYKGIAKSTYFHRLNSISYLERNKATVDMIVECITNDRFGNPSVVEIRDYLTAKYGVIVNHKKIEKIVDLLELSKKIKLKKESTYTGEPDHDIPNIVNRNFKTSKPLEIILTDISFFKFPFGMIAFQSYYDCFNGEILTHVVSPSKAFKYTKQLLDQLIEKYKDKLEGTIMHSDRGFEYKHPVYMYMLKKYKMIQSMSRKANCHDNSPIESFHGVMKRKIYTKDNKDMYSNYEEVKDAIDDFINLYNNKSRRALGGLSPIAYRKEWEQKNQI